MSVKTFTAEQNGLFLDLADRERWVILPWELAYLQSAFPAGCLSWVDTAGRARGFVTSCRHRSSGWIGNLIVDRDFRGQGIGRELFTRALSSLLQSGVTTIWLTASKDGRPIYEQEGFCEIDTIIRFASMGKERGTEKLQTNLPHTIDHLSLDATTWGDDRSALLEKTMAIGQLITHDQGFLIIQPVGNRLMFGPWSAYSREAAELLIKAAARTLGSAEFFIDVPIGNQAAVDIFSRMGLEIVGENSLMYQGKIPLYHPELLYGLATMGSCG